MWRATVQIIFFAAVAIIVFVAWPLVIGAAYQPMARKTVRRMLQIAQVTSEDTVFDLGSGDGRVVVAAAKEFGATAIGIEADPIRVLVSRLIIRFNRLHGRARIVWGDFFKANLHAATVITMFQTQGTNDRVRPKLEKELKKGAKVVSHHWTFKGWPPDQVDTKNNLYLYVMSQTENNEHSEKHDQKESQDVLLT